MEIKIIGASSANGKILRNRVLEAAMEVDDKITISLLNDNEYHVKKSPALVIDNDITIEGRMITTKELSKILKRKTIKK